MKLTIFDNKGMIGYEYKCGLPAELKFEDLKELTETQPWSPFEFNEQCQIINCNCSGENKVHRKMVNFVSTELFVFDVDGTESLNNLIETFKDYNVIIGTSRHHQKPKGSKCILNEGNPCYDCKNKKKILTPEEEAPKDRSRVILRIKKITDANEYNTTWAKTNELYSFGDQSTKDSARFFYPSKVVFYNFNGKDFEINTKRNEVAQQWKNELVKPTIFSPTNDIYGLSPSSIRFFHEGAENGIFNKKLYDCARNANDKGWEEKLFIERWNNQIPNNFNEFDKTDLSTIHSAFKNEPNPYKTKKIETTDEERVIEWLQQKGVQKIAGNKYNWGKKIADFNILNDFIYLDFDKTPNPIRIDKIKIILEKWDDEEGQKIIDYISTFYPNLAYSKENEEFWNNLSLIICNEINLQYIAVLKHFFWQVKRKMRGLNVWEHMMPVFSGKSKSGKTTLIEKIMLPIKEFTETAQSLETFSTPKESYRFCERFILFHDEMAKAKKTELEQIKNKITSKEISYQMFYKQKTATARNLSTQIGASEKPLSDLIVDYSMMRRFFEVKTLEKMDLQKILKLDFCEAFKSVNEYEDHPLTSIYKQIEDAQMELVSKSAVKVWLEERCDIDPVGDKWISVDDSFDNFASWFGNNNHNPFGNKIIFSKELSRVLLQDYKINKDLIQKKKTGKRVSTMPITIRGRE